MKLWVAYAALFCGLPAFDALHRTAPHSQVVFTNVAARAGIHFVHHNGAFGKKYLPETMGSGCAFVDLDGDGWPDILLLNDKDWSSSGKKYTSALYRNN